MYIPFEGSFNTLAANWFTLQMPASGLDPNKMIKKFSCFKYNRYMNEFKFVNEDGVEFMTQCFRTDGESTWRTVVSILGSNNISRDIDEFYNWLSDNFVARCGPRK